MTNRVRLTSYLLDMIGSIIEKVLVGPPSWSLATLIKFREKFNLRFFCEKVLNEKSSMKENEENGTLMKLGIFEPWLIPGRGSPDRAFAIKARGMGSNLSMLQ